jgi:hypothetical protein
MAIEQPASRERYRKLTLPSGSAEFWLEPAGSRVKMHTVRPNGHGETNWARCDAHGCLGEAVTSDSKCLRHATSDARNNHLSSLHGRNKSLSLRGVAVDQSLADAILRSPPFAERRVDVYMSLAGADISGRLSFEGYTFAQGIDVTGAIIHETGGFGLRRCELESSLSTQFTFFNAAPPNISECNFIGEVYLDYAHVERTSISFWHMHVYKKV